MKKFCFTIISLMIFFQINPFLAKGEQKEYSIVEVITPSEKIYEDGIHRIKFSSFYVVDNKGNKIISSGEVFDYPVKIKLYVGNYKIYYRSSKGKLISKDLNIEKGNFLEVKFY